MKQQAIILSVIALASTIFARHKKPEVHINHRFTLTGKIFHESEDPSERLYAERKTKSNVRFRLHVNSDENYRLQVIEKVDTGDKYAAYTSY